MIRILARLRRADLRGSRDRPAAAGQSRQGQRDRDRHHQGPHRHQAADRHRAPACRAHQAAGARGLLQQRAVPPRDGRLHGADRRRPEFQRHRRLEISEPEAEFSNVPFKRGIVGMARRGDSVDTANSQFFIMFADGSSLNGQYTVIGEVVSGMDVVDKLKKAPPGSSRRRGDRSRQDGEGASRIRHQVSGGAAARQASSLVCSGAV